MFTLHVESVGTFTFKKRNFRDTFAIEAEYSRLTEGVASPTPMLAGFARATATLKVLTIQAPESWDLMEADPFDEKTYTRLIAVYGALSDKEAFFRPGGGPERQ